MKNLKTNNYYYQDASGSTSHLASSSGTLLEWYRYDLQGTPVFYDSRDRQISASAYGVRHLFTGQQWYSDVGLYDLRNRFYSPDIGRFLQPDPIGFGGDPTNLYRYCQNNPVKRRDPLGLGDQPIRIEDQTPGTVTLNPGVTVTGSVPSIWSSISSIWSSIWGSIFNSNYFGFGPNFLGAQAPPNLIPWGWSGNAFSGPNTKLKLLSCYLTPFLFPSYLDTTPILLPVKLGEPTWAAGCIGSPRPTQFILIDGTGGWDIFFKEGIRASWLMQKAICRV